MRPTLRRCFAKARHLGEPPGRGLGLGNGPASSWVSEASAQPVSQESLAGIPWAGRSTLANLFTRVAARGPKDPAVWRKLVSRADVIAHSLTAKQAALVISALARAQHRSESFLRRFSVRFAPSLLQEAELLDLCGIISGLSQLGAYSEETFDLAAKRVAAAAPHLDAKQFSLVANAFVRVAHADKALFERLLHVVPRRLRGCTGKDAAVLLNALAQLPGLLPNDIPASSLDPPLEAIALRLPELLPSADLHSLTLMLNAFAQLNFVQKDVLDLVTQELLCSGERFQRLTPRQLAMVLNALARLQLFEPRLLNALSTQIRACAKALDPQSLCVMANACARLPALGVETFQALYAQVPRLLTRLSGRQLAMLCHAWGKAHVHNDDLFALLALPLAQKAGSLTAYEVALSVYGYAHFRKAPPELFNRLLQRISELTLESGTMDDGVLLMLANALGRVGWHDDTVASALRDYVAREPGMRHLLPQTKATFGLTASPSLEATAQR